MLSRFTKQVHHIFLSTIIKKKNQKKHSDNVDVNARRPGVADLLTYLLVVTHNICFSFSDCLTVHPLLLLPSTAIPFLKKRKKKNLCTSLFYSNYLISDPQTHPASLERVPASIILRQIESLIALYHFLVSLFSSQFHRKLHLSSGPPSLPAPR